MTHSVLALDCSSVCIGWAFVDDAAAEVGRIDLRVPGRGIGAQARKAERDVKALLELWKPALVILEGLGFTARSTAGAIPQIIVRGGVLMALDAMDALYTELTPGQGKIALTGAGDCGIKQGTMTKDEARKLRKQRMITAAVQRLGLDDVMTVRPVRGVLTGFDACGMPLLTEDEADAYALALAGRAVRVEVVQ